MAPALVQTKATPAAATTSFAATLTSAPSAGNLLIAYVSASPTSTVAPVITLPSGWVQADISQPTAKINVQIAYLANCGTATSYTFAFSLSSDVSIILEEWSGCATASPLDVHTHNSTTTATVTTGTTGTTGQASELIVWCLGYDQTAALTYSAILNSYTASTLNTEQSGGTPVANLAAWNKTVAATGTQNSGCTLSAIPSGGSGNTGVVIATFKAATAAIITHAAAAKATLALARTHAVAGQASLALARTNAAAAKATLALARTHTVTTSATLALARTHAVAARASLALARTHTATTSATVALARVHASTGQASLALVRSHAIAAKATLSLARTHAVAGQVSLALVRPHAAVCSATIALARTHAVATSTSLALVRNHPATAQATLALLRSHALAARETLALVRSHALAASAVLQAATTTIIAHPVQASAALVAHDTVATGVGTATPLQLSQRAVADFSDGAHAAFYYDGTNLVVRASLDGGVTWGSATTVTSVTQHSTSEIHADFAQAGDTLYGAVMNWTGTVWQLVPFKGTWHTTTQTLGLSTGTATTVSGFSPATSDPAAGATLLSVAYDKNHGRVHVGVVTSTGLNIYTLALSSLNVVFSDTTSNSLVASNSNLPIIYANGTIWALGDNGTHNQYWHRTFGGTSYGAWSSAATGAGDTLTGGAGGFLDTTGASDQPGFAWSSSGGNLWIALYNGTSWTETKLVTGGNTGASVQCVAGDLWVASANSGTCVIQRTNGTWGSQFLVDSRGTRCAWASVNQSSGVVVLLYADGQNPGTLRAAPFALNPGHALSTKASLALLNSTGIAAAAVLNQDNLILISQVQTSAVAASSVTSLNAAFSAGTATGSLLIAYVLASPLSGGAPSITLPSGWSLADTSTPVSKINLLIAYMANATPGTTTFTFGFSATCDVSIILEEWQGLDTTNVLDVHANNATTTATVTTGTTASTTIPTELVVWALGYDNSTALTYSSILNGFNTSAENTTSSTGSPQTNLAAFNVIVHTLGAQSSGATLSAIPGGASHNTGVVIATFKAPAGVARPLNAATSLALARTHALGATATISLAGSGAGSGTPLLVQTNSGSTGNSTTATPTLLNPTNGGNLVVAYITAAPTSGLAPTLTLPSGWLVAAASTPVASVNLWIAYLPDCPVGQTAFTFGFAQPSDATIVLEEWANLALSNPLDVTATQATTSTTVTTGTTASTAQAHELVVWALGYDNGAVLGSSSLIGSFTASTQNTVSSSGAPQANLAAWNQVVAATGTQASGVTLSGVPAGGSGTTAAAIATFRASAGLIHRTTAVASLGVATAHQVTAVANLHFAHPLVSQATLALGRVHATATRVNLSAARVHAVAAMACVLGPTIHTVQTAATLLLRSTHPVVSAASLALLRRHASTASAAIVYVRTRPVAAKVTLARAPTHSVATAASLALVQSAHSLAGQAVVARAPSHAATALASLALAKAHALSSGASVAVVRAHTLGARATLALARARSTTAQASVGLVRTQTAAAQVALAAFRLHGAVASASLALVRGHGVGVAAVLLPQSGVHSHSIGARAVIGEAGTHPLATRTTLALVRSGPASRALAPLAVVHTQSLVASAALALVRQHTSTASASLAVVHGPQSATASATLAVAHTPGVQAAARLARGHLVVALVTLARAASHGVTAATSISDAVLVRTHKLRARTVITLGRQTSSTAQTSLSLVRTHAAGCSATIALGHPTGATATASLALVRTGHAVATVASLGLARTHASSAQASVALLRGHALGASARLVRGHPLGAGAGLALARSHGLAAACVTTASAIAVTHTVRARADITLAAVHAQAAQAALARVLAHPVGAVGALSVVHQTAVQPRASLALLRTHPLRTAASLGVVQVAHPALALASLALVRSHQASSAASLALARGPHTAILNASVSQARSHASSAQASLTVATAHALLAVVSLSSPVALVLHPLRAAASLALAHPLAIGARVSLATAGRHLVSSGATIRRAHASVTQASVALLRSHPTGARATLASANPHALAAVVTLRHNRLIVASVTLGLLRRPQVSAQASLALLRRHASTALVVLAQAHAHPLRAQVALSAYVLRPVQASASLSVPRSHTAPARAVVFNPAFSAASAVRALASGGGVAGLAVCPCSSTLAAAPAPAATSVAPGGARIALMPVLPTIFPQDPT